MDNLRKQARREAHGHHSRNPSATRVPTENTPLITTTTPNGTSPEHVSSGSSRYPHIWGSDDENQFTALPKQFLHISWLTVASNYVNVLLVFVPLGIVAGAMGWNPTTVFALNFLAIVPLAALLSFATEELSARLGQTVGGLMNATFGNAVELIVSIVALNAGEIRIVQAGMLGSILSNILLVLGCCFIAAGWAGGEQEFNATVANTMASLLAVASASLIIPAALSAALMSSSPVKDIDIERSILTLSRGTSIILLALYVLYLFFQLKTHASLFDEEQAQEGESEGPQLLTPIPAGVALLLVTLLVAVCAEYLVGSIESVVESTGMSRTFIGLILLPIVGNAAEHVTACIVAAKGKMDLALGVAIGSSLQIAIFVTPFLVILGWIIGQKMTLNFQGFETVVFFVSILVVNYLIQDGKSNYLEGAMCLGTYIIVAIAFWVYPETASENVLSMVKNFFRT